MILKIFPRNDGTGILDDEMKDGDPLEVFPDSYEASLGVQDKKSYLCLKIPDPPNYEAVAEAFVQADYAPNPNVPEGVVIRRMRKYWLNWRSAFTAEEVAVIEDSSATLTDGELASGGTVTAGVVSGKFDYQDFNRKA